MLYLGIYFLFINFLSFVVWGVDKRKAVKQKWRISEKSLLILSLIGGFLGGFLGMKIRRHKTIKSRFLWKFYLICGVWIVGIVFGFRKIL